MSTVFEVPCPGVGDRCRSPARASCSAPTCAQRYHARMGHLFPVGEPARGVTRPAATWPAGVGSRDVVRIAQVAPLYEAVPPGAYGGTERVIATLCDGLVAQGHEVTLFAPETSETAAKLEAFGQPLRERLGGRSWSTSRRTCTCRCWPSSTGGATSSTSCTPTSTSGRSRSPGCATPPRC